MPAGQTLKPQMRSGSSLRRWAVPLAAAASVLALASCGDKAALPKGNASLVIAEFEFKPDPMVLPVGTDLRVSNEDKDPHTVTADDKSFDTGPVEHGKHKPLILSKVGDFPYACTIHPTMRGVIRVRE